MIVKILFLSIQEKYKEVRPVEYFDSQTFVSIINPDNLNPRFIWKYEKTQRLTMRQSQGSW